MVESWWAAQGADLKEQTGIAASAALFVLSQDKVICCEIRLLKFHPGGGVPCCHLHLPRGYPPAFPHTRVCSSAYA